MITQAYYICEELTEMVPARYDKDDPLGRYKKGDYIIDGKCNIIKTPESQRLVANGGCARLNRTPPLHIQEHAIAGVQFILGPRCQ